MSLIDTARHLELVRSVATGVIRLASAGIAVYAAVTWASAIPLRASNAGEMSLGRGFSVSTGTHRVWSALDVGTVLTLVVTLSALCLARSLARALFPFPDFTRCPRCGQRLSRGPKCTACRLDLSSDPAPGTPASSDL